MHTRRWGRAWHVESAQETQLLLWLPMAWSAVLSAAFHQNLTVQQAVVAVLCSGFGTQRKGDAVPSWLQTVMLDGRTAAWLQVADAGLLEPPERPRGSPASSSVWMSRVRLSREQRKG